MYRRLLAFVSKIVPYSFQHTHKNQFISTAPTPWSRWRQLPEPGKEKKCEQIINYSWLHFGGFLLRSSSIVSILSPALIFLHRTIEKRNRKMKTRKSTITIHHSPMRTDPTIRWKTWPPIWSSLSGTVGKRFARKFWPPRNRRTSGTSRLPPSQTSSVLSAGGKECNQIVSESKYLRPLQ